MSRISLAVVVVLERNTGTFFCQAHDRKLTQPLPLLAFALYLPFICPYLLSFIMTVNTVNRAKGHTAHGIKL